MEGDASPPSCSSIISHKVGSSVGSDSIVQSDDTMVQQSRPAMAW